MAEYYIERLNEKNAIEWDEFNNNSRDGSFFHCLKWIKIADNTSKFKSHYFLLYRNGSIFGIFPFIEQNIRFFRGLVPAHNLYPLLKDYRDPSAMQCVITDLYKINGYPKKISFVRFSTLYNEMIDSIQKYPGFPTKEPGYMVLDLLECPPEKIWNNFTAKKGQRKFIRRFEDDGYQVRELHSEEDLKLFYHYYRENILVIGGILHPFSHFNDILNSFTPDEVRITLLSGDSDTAGGLLMFPYKPLKTVYLTYLSLNRNLPNTYHPTYYLFWEAVNWAWNNHYEKISFGTVPGDENNPRFRIKYEFGGKYEPVYSRTISLSSLFTAAVKVHTLFR